MRVKDVCLFETRHLGFYSSCGESRAPGSAFCAGHCEEGEALLLDETSTSTWVDCDHKAMGGEIRCIVHYALALRHKGGE